MNVGAIIPFRLPRHDRPVHRMRPLEHIWYIRYVRLWWLLDHPVMTCNHSARDRLGPGGPDKH